MEFLPIGIPYRCHMRHFHVSDSQFLTARISAADYHYFCHVVLFCSERLVANTTLLNSENVKFKREEQELHFLFRMKREQMRSYIFLGRKTYPSSIVEKLVNDLDPETARNLIINMHAYTTEAKSVLRRLKMNLPELTLSERDICLLIIQGKKQGEICRLLNKSKSNINTQRVNIRKKLMLKPEENLYEFLKRAVGITLQTNAILSASHANKTARFLTRKKHMPYNKKYKALVFKISALYF